MTMTATNDASAEPIEATETATDEPSSLKAPAETPTVVASSELAVAPDIGRGALRDVSIDARIRYAQELAAAGLLPKAFRENPGNVLYAVEYGNMLGIHPLAAITGVHVLDGKPTASPALMSALVRRAGHTLRVRVDGTLEDGDLKATATLIRFDDTDNPFVSSWTPKRAKRAGLVDSYAADATTGEYVIRSRTSNGNPSAWEKFTEAMCKARAIGEVCREGAEEALCGVHYTPEELGVQVDEDGVVIVETSLVEPAEPQVDPAEIMARNVEALRVRLEDAQTVDVLTDYYKQVAGRDDAQAVLESLTHDVNGVACTVFELFATIGKRLRGDDGSGDAQSAGTPSSGPSAPDAGNPAQESSQDAGNAWPTPATAAEIDAELDGAPSEPTPRAVDEREAGIVAQLSDDDRAAWLTFGRREPYVGTGAPGAVASATLDDEEAEQVTLSNVDRAHRLRVSSAAWYVQAQIDDNVDADDVTPAKLVSSRPRAAMLRARAGL